MDFAFELYTVRTLFRLFLTKMKMKIMSKVPSQMDSVDEVHWYVSTSFSLDFFLFFYTDLRWLNWG